MMLIPETPSFLYSKKKWKELHSCFDTFSYINKGKILKMKFDKEEENEQTKEKNNISLKNLVCEERSRTINLILMVLNW